ncbi:hypothetical protein LRP31_14115 [Mesorhizobium mediterraneum]|uniref:hypothetical protein n=1 Tax=Mesorhizobium mediterraneum TaxID=43617 RepID=UPI00142E75E7|nr:hypothetical protein [Mesorhizobium mediterraneum]WIW56208.1 hypothetical protein LRP31_14115 [Mesorhizobium mediterraneum]
MHRFLLRSSTAHGNASVLMGKATNASLPTLATTPAEMIQTGCFAAHAHLGDVERPFQ